MYDVRLGPLRFVTLKEEAKEALGGAVETAGGAVTAGPRAPRDFTFVLPVRDDRRNVDDPIEAGKRLRRQLRALLRNDPARLGGLSFVFSIDPELDGWLLVGTADLEPEEGGITFAEWKLSVGSAFQLGTRRTHRPARRLTAVDRRLAATPRDLLGTVYSEDFADEDATVEHFLPVGAADVAGFAGRVVESTDRPTLDGDVFVVADATPGETVSFEEAVGDELKADVAIYDRRGNTTP